MNFADRVRESTTSTSAAVITLAGAVAKFRSFAGALTVGMTDIPVSMDDGAGNWEDSFYTLTDAATLTRTEISASSNGGAATVFPAGVKDVFCTVHEGALRRLQSAAAGVGSGVRDVTFSQSIPLSVAGQAYMPQQAVSSVLAFTPAAAAVRGALVYLRLIADGTNAPTFSGMKEWGGSLGYDNRNGIANQVQFFCDGTDVFYSISQAVGATAAPAAATAVTLTGPTGGIVSIASGAFTVGVSPVGGTITGSVVATPSDGGAGGTFSPTTVTLTSANPTGTCTYTPSSTGARTISVTNNGGLSNPAGITYTATAAATVPGAPTIGTATAGDASASVTYTPPASNGGAAILDYTVTASPGGATATGTGSPINVAGLTNGTAHTFTVKARNSVGSSAASAASNSVTPVAAPVAPRMGTLVRVAETGANTNVYAGSAAGGFGGTPAEGDSIMTTAFQSGVDGSVVMKLLSTPTNGGDEVLFGLDASNATIGYVALDYGIVGHATAYDFFTSGSFTANSAVSGAPNDYIRFTRTGSALVAEVSKNNGSTWTAIKTWTGVSTGAMYFHALVAKSGSFTPISATGLA